MPEVICFVNVNLPDSRIEKIIVREGDDLELVANLFSKQFSKFILNIISCFRIR